MTKFILHGGFTRKDTESNRLFFKEFLHDVPRNGNVLLVYFASRTEGTVAVSAEQIQKLEILSRDKNLKFIIADTENFLNQIRQSDAIYIHGGSTSKLLNILRMYPDLKLMVEGKTIAGSSAGTYALACFSPSHSEEVVREGLGLVPLRVICHYESLELPPNIPAINLVRETAQELELVTLKDCEWKVFEY